jgi:hypothetical protein
VILQPLGDHVVTRLRAPTTEDAFGNPIRQWGSAAELSISDCSVQPVFGDEQTVGRDTVVTRWRLYAPLGTDLLASDRIRYASVVYEVDGDVESWDFEGGYVSVLLQKVT